MRTSGRTVELGRGYRLSFGTGVCVPLRSDLVAIEGAERALVDRALSATTGMWVAFSTVTPSFGGSETIAKASGLSDDAVDTKSALSLWVSAAQTSLDDGFEVPGLMNVGGWRNATAVFRYIERAEINEWPESIVLTRHHCGHRTHPSTTPQRIVPPLRPGRLRALLPLRHGFAGMRGPREISERLAGGVDLVVMRLVREA